MRTRHLWGLGLLIAIGLALLAPNTYYLFLLGMVAITTVVGVGLNVLTGLTGQTSIGHAGFFAIGAYSGVIAMKQANWGFWPGTILGIGVAAATGAILAAPALRVRGPYLAMVTIAFGIIVERVLIEWVSLTGGFGGISAIPKPELFGLEPAIRDVVVIVMGVAFVCLLAFRALKHHAWGRAFQAVRDDEVAATALGLNALGVRIMAFAISAGFTGLAGVFFASAIGFISPDSFTFHRSILFLLVVILGGLGTAEGALLGAIVLVILPEFLHDFEDYQLLVFGLLLVLTLGLAPEGITPLWARRLVKQPILYPPKKQADLDFATPQTSIPDLKVEQVGIQFGGIRAVDQVDLQAHSGTVTAVIGPNGAGKTTLLNLISGFYKTQTGHIYLGDQELTMRSSVDIARLGITRTFQATRLFNSLTVLDNLRIARSGGQLGSVLSAFWGIGRADRPEAELLDLLAFVGYQGNVYQQASDLPFVDRRLVEIARALATDPRVMLLDEPAAGLSRGDKHRLAELIRQIADRGAIVILIEHDMDLVMGISDQVIVLDSGQVICTGSPAQVQRDPQVLEAYLGVSDASLSREPVQNSKASLQIRHLRVGYGELQVLDDLSLQVDQGELVAVIGANGAGKSTLMKSIFRLLTPWSGQVIFQGKDLTQVSPDRMAQLGIVLVPEGRQVFAEQTVVDNLRLGAFHRQDDGIGRDIEAILDRFPRLRLRQFQRAGSLSGGEQQMLAIGRGLMAKPKLLLLDEPSLGLAPKLVSSLFETLAELRDEGITILLVDQMATLALSVADRAYLLESGQIIRSGSAAELKGDPMIAQAYLGGVIQQSF